MKLKAFFQIFLVVSLSVIFSAELSFGADTNIAGDGDKSAMNGCCLQTNSGDACSYVSKDKCSGSFVPSSCSELPECSLGVCEYDAQGCFPNVAKKKCVESGGNFLGLGELSEYSQCNLGCCVLGSQCKPGTEKECKSIFAKYPGLKFNFQDANSEKECVDICRAKDIGCCVMDEGCSKLSREECSITGGEYNSGKCSDVCSQCSGEKELKCVSEDRDVHSFDLCGNDEGVVQACFAGESCKDGKCVSMDCSKTWDNPAVEGDGVERKNGEAWCEYDSNIGPGVDLPGAEHYVHSCVNGVEMVERCEKTSARDQICIQGGNEARCVDANQEHCLKCEDEKCCNSGKGICVWLGNEDRSADKEAYKKNLEDKNISIEYSPGNTDGVCMPFVSKGITFWKEGNEDACDKGDLNGEKGLKTFWSYAALEGSWDCDSNCIAYTPEYAFMTNQKCNSYGDCGAKYNLVGKWGNDAFTRNCDFGDRKSTINIEDVGDIGDVALIGGDEDFNSGKPLIEGYTGSEGYGDGGEMANKLISGCEKYISDPENFEEIYKGYKGGFDAENLFANEHWSWVGMSQNTMAGIGVAVAAGAAAGAIAGGVAYALGALMAGFWAIPFWGWIAAAVLTTVMLIFKRLGNEYEGNVQVDCGVWQAPLGDADCSKCSDPKYFGADGLHECSEYKCMSLGQACEYVDTVDGYMCVAGGCDKNAASARIIPWDEMELSCASGTCNVEEFENGFKIDGKLDPFKRQTFGVKTLNKNTGDEAYATCVFAKTNEVDEEGNLVGLEVSRSKSIVHNVTLNPYLEAGAGSLYAQCVDVCDNKNRAVYEIQYDVAQEPDITPPMIESFEPETGGLVISGNDKSQVVLNMNEKTKKCKWDFMDMNYEDMANSVSCAGDGMKCNALLTGIKKEPLNYYFRCEDVSGNVNAMSESYVVSQSESLLISSVSCIDRVGSECGRKIMGRNFTLNVQTAFGAEDGNSLCSVFGAYAFDMPGEENIHEINLGPFDTGNYNFDIKCKDKIGNKNETKVDFEIFVDAEAPKIIKVFTENGVLNVASDKSAECYYSNAKEFNFDNKFSVTGDLKHSTAVGSEQYFRVGCESALFGVRTSSPIDIYLV